MTMDVAIALAFRHRHGLARRIMVKDQDFGEIPGTQAEILLKPGAEKLCNFFGRDVRRSWKVGWTAPSVW
jgi:hypothetical protein